MNLRHAAALTLVGWYLMMPPNVCDVSSACNGKSIFWNAVAAIRDLSGRNESSYHSEMAWFHRMGNEVVPDAPLSEWHQVDEFETLAECRAGYEKNQKAPSNEQEQDLDLAKLELADEGKANPSGHDLRSRADLLRSFFTLQTIQEKCIGSDDPRLAK